MEDKIDPHVSAEVMRLWPATAAGVTPTPETHRYVGMWRPPIESILKPSECNSYIDCPCGRHWVDVRWGRVCDWSPAGKNLHEEFMNHWLAGHFDTPQYELKSTAEIMDQSIAGLRNAR